MDHIFILNSIMLGFGLAMDAFCVSMTNGLTCQNLNVRNRLKMAGTYAGFQFLMPLIGWFCVRTVAERFALFHRMVPWIALLLLLYIGGKMLLEAWQIRQSRVEHNAREESLTEDQHADTDDPLTEDQHADTDDPLTEDQHTDTDDSLTEDHHRSDAGASPKGAQSHQEAKIQETPAPAMISWPVLIMQGIATSIDALSVGFTIVDYSLTTALTACLIIAIVTLLVCLTGIRIGQALGNVLEEKANVLGGCILIFIGLEIFIKGVIL